MARFVSYSKISFDFRGIYFWKLTNDPPLLAHFKLTKSSEDECRSNKPPAVPWSICMWHEEYCCPDPEKVTISQSFCLHGSYVCFEENITNWKLWWLCAEKSNETLYDHQYDCWFGKYVSDLGFSFFSLCSTPILINQPDCISAIRISLRSS